MIQLKGYSHFEDKDGNKYDTAYINSDDLLTGNNGDGKYDGNYFKLTIKNDTIYMTTSKKYEQNLKEILRKNYDDELLNGLKDYLSELLSGWMDNYPKSGTRIEKHRFPTFTPEDVRKTGFDLIPIKVGQSTGSVGKNNANLADLKNQLKKAVDVEDY